ncbi:guanine nucleotide exchange factor [Calycina marina]|uniref:Guanine nucleotide exchange factor n=1 Tax=Calycina marina TaxID=1763456 RepID=A0A9P7ZC79_9HELO|nr:guanine nucleotide exchange factor [Calycina marina]
MATPILSISSTEIAGPAKLKEITRLMDILSSDLEKVTLLPHQRDAHLEQLKVYGRDPSNSDPIFTKQGIETLTRHALNSPSLTTSRNALRCLANAMFLRPETRKIFLDLRYEAKICNKLKNDSRDDEFLASRVIFLTTYDASVDLEIMIDQWHLAENICTNLGRHTKQYTTKQKGVKEIDPMEDMALIESLKLLFNVTHFCPERAGAFSPAIPHIFMLLTRRPVMSSKPLDPPIGTLINALLNLELEAKDNAEKIFPRAAPNANVDRLIDILEQSTKAYTDDDLEHLASPLLTLLRKAHEVAQKDVQSHLKQRLLPSDADRLQPLGRTETLPSRLIRLSSNATTPSIRESISSLLFDLSEKDATKMVQNIGYGFASGFLFSHNIPIPENAAEAWSTSDSGSSRPRASNDSSKPVNPITGQHLDAEQVVELPEMTQEEKENEAERLYVLFERLRATGVVNVENPVHTAMRKGRFTEVDDEDSD